MMYSAANSHSSSVADSPRFNRTGIRALPGPAQQREVLHVARADLNHVAVTFDEIDACFVECFRNDLQAVNFAHVGEYFESFFAEALKRVW
jgi:hypothetical protein